MATVLRWSVTETIPSFKSLYKISGLVGGSES